MKDEMADYLEAYAVQFELRCYAERFLWAIPLVQREDDPIFVMVSMAESTANISAEQGVPG